MIELTPLVYQPLFFWPRPVDVAEDPVTLNMEHKLMWNLYVDAFGYACYRCQTAIAATGDYDQNVTPLFPVIENGKRIKQVPDHIEEWMRRYTETFQAGAYWARSVKLK